MAVHCRDHQFATMNIDNDQNWSKLKDIAYRKIFNDRIDLTFYVDADKTIYLFNIFELMDASIIAGEDLELIRSK